VLGEGPKPLARRQYVIQAPRQRVWDLLAGTIIQCMPVEQMQIVNDTTFRAVLKLKLGPLEVPMRLEVRAADISPIDSLCTLVKAKKGPFESALKVSFALTDASEESTSVVCTATEDGGSPWMWLLKGQQRSFAGDMFDAISAELVRCC
jgi:carbon monoxide dehydrogenase subunit G